MRDINHMTDRSCTAQSRKSDTLPIITEEELQGIAEDIHAVSSRVAQEVFLQRRSEIFRAIQEITGTDYSAQIPAVRKGRPSKRTHQQK